MYLEKVKNFGAANNEELKIETGKLKITGAVSNNCHAELVSASDQYGANVNFQTEKTLKAEKADGIYAGKREPKSRQRSEVMTGASAQLFQERVQGDSEWDAKGNGKLKINGIKHPNIFNSKKRYGFTLDEDTEIISEDVNLSPLAGSKIASADVNLSPLRGKYPPEAVERGLMKRGFTLAEVLITLVVIGVVAAITIPVLHSNTQGKEWNAAKQKARAGMGEAFKLISVQNELPDITADEFARTVLPRYIKLAKNCTSAVECGFPDEIKTVKGTKFQTSSDLNSNTTWGSMQTTTALTSNGTQAVAADIERAYKPAFFQTVDGFSVAMFYNPRCRAGETDNPWHASNEANGIVRDTSIGAACFSAIYDMNGKKGPNRVGDDIGFVGSFYYGVQARSAAVLPVKDGEVMSNETTFDEASAICKKAGRPGDLDLATIDELTLIYLNNKLVGVDDTSLNFWSRSPVGGGTGKVQHMCFRTSYPGQRSWPAGDLSGAVRCVRADKLM